MKKRIVLMLVLMLTMSMSMMADNIKVITFNQLPMQAQTILKQHFADKVPAVVTVEGKEYKVVYQSGEKRNSIRRVNGRKSTAICCLCLPLSSLNRSGQRCNKLSLLPRSLRLNAFVRTMK